MNRRRFVALSAFALAGVAAGQRATRLLGRIPSRTSRLASVGGYLEVPLDCAETWAQLGSGQAQLYTYNAISPGPTLEVRAGDTLRVILNNKLAEATNLHFHGMHLPPSGMADNIFLATSSQGQTIYDLTVPISHPAGLFWYHPHMHGSVTRQVTKGLAGLIVVRGDLDAIPEVAAATEHMLVLQEFDQYSSDSTIGVNMMGVMNWRQPGGTFVNGQVQPTFSIQKNGLARLRILNASAMQFYRLSLEAHPMHIIATDGGALPSPISVDEVTLAPGQRIDVLVEGDRDPGSYRILALPYMSSRMGTMNGMVAGNTGMTGLMPMGLVGMSRPTRPMRGQGATGTSGDAYQTLAVLQYVGQSSNPWSVPTSLGSVERLQASGLPLRTFTLGQSLTGGMGTGGMGTGGMGTESMGALTINGQSFDPARIDTQVSVNSVEDWEYVNQTMMDHPMHVHTNSFQIVGADGQAEQAWRDIVTVVAGATVRIRIPFRDFTGKSAQHCHILPHEDMGMMATVQIG